MSRTHLAIGVGTALAVFHPQTAQGCCLAIMGGAVGGIMPDIDILDNDYTGDALLGQVIAAGLTAGTLAIDWFLKLGIMEYLLLRNKILLIAGIVFFMVMYFVGMPQPHRGFTHSLVALLVYSLPILIMCPMVVPYYAVGFASHLVIDLFNKKKIRLFFPLKGGLCFGFCYANKGGNRALMYIGLAVSLVMLLNGLFLHLLP